MCVGPIEIVLLFQKTNLVSIKIAISNNRVSIHFCLNFEFILRRMTGIFSRVFVRYDPG